MDNVRKYLPHGISLLFLLNAILVFALKDHPMVLMFGLLTVVFGIGIVVEIINTIIKIQDEEVNVNQVKTYAMLILLNLYYVPCFHLQYIENDEDYKKKNIIYLIISIILSIVLIVLIVLGRNYSKPLPVEIKSYDGDISFRMPNGYIQSEEGAVDYVFFKDDFVTKINIIKGDYDPAEYMNWRTTNFLEENMNIKSIENTTYDVGNKTIRKNVLEGIYSDSDEEKKYVISIVSSKDKPNTIVSVFQYCDINNYDKYKKNIDKIIDSIEFN